MYVKEIIDTIIDYSIERGKREKSLIGRTLRLDNSTYKELASELRDYASIGKGEIETYRGLHVRIDRESWINKIYIEIE